MFMNRFSLVLALAGFCHFAGLTAVSAQPAAPATADIPCQAEPGTDEAPSSSQVDAEGYVSLFDGLSFKGWWHNCKSEDSQSNRTMGGVWKVDPTQQAIYSNQRGMGEGSMLVTNKKYGNHEIVLELWPDWGNDGGIFHRTDTMGKSFQTVLDYYQSACIGGAYPQELQQGFYQCSYTFNTESTVAKGNYASAPIDYTQFEMAKMWDPDGWNEIKVKFFGSPPRHQVWLRKSGVTEWTQVLDVKWPDAYATLPLSGHIGLQVHYGTYWKFGGKGNWYRNIRVRELDADGMPLVTAVKPKRGGDGRFLAVRGNRLVGDLESDSRVTVRDLAGRVLAEFVAKAGRLDAGIKETRGTGVLLVELKVNSGLNTIRVPRF